MNIRVKEVEAKGNKEKQRMTTYDSSPRQGKKRKSAFYHSAIVHHLLFCTFMQGATSDFDGGIKREVLYHDNFLNSS